MTSDSTAQLRDAPRPRVSVVLPTKDRGEAIDATLAALAAQDFDDYEVVIVDNRSRAEDAVRLRSWADREDRLRYVREEEPGLNRARNRGIAEARGEVVAFLDDDAIAPPHWVSSLARGCAAYPDAWAFGGRVVSRFTSAAPEWLDERRHRFLSGFDKGSEVVALHYDEYPRGANMAFRREAFAECGPFLECLDRKGDSLLSYGDIEMCYRVERAGHRVLYLPDAEVEHLIRGDRLTPAWFDRRFHWQGRSVAIFERVHFGRWHLLRLLPYRLLRCLLGGDRHGRRYHRGLVASSLACLFWRRLA